jgi:hypothetical protein
MLLGDAHAFMMAGFSEPDVEEILEDLDYLYANAVWPYTLEKTREMVVDSPDILLEFLRAVEKGALRSAMIPRRIKRLVAG